MDGFRTLNDKEAIDAIREIRPKIVVPIHYRVFRGGREIAKKVMRTVENEEKATEFRELTYGETMEI
jgi:L-ascorbate metabolism protein UlaG (beta-lactamase superfamily)